MMLEKREDGERKLFLKTLSREAVNHFWPRTVSAVILHMLGSDFMSSREASNFAKCPSQPRLGSQNFSS